MTVADRQASIEYILEKGLITRETVWERARRILRHLGLRLVFWDGAYTLVFAVFTVGVMAAVAALAPQQWRYSIAVGCSPALFLLIVCLTEITERFTDLYELRQTCHFTTRQITAVRVMCYSVAGIVATAVVAGLTATDVADFWSLLSLNLAALFICAAVQIFLLSRSGRHCLWLAASAVVAWALIAGGIPAAIGSRWEFFLSSLSITVTSLVALVGVGLLLAQIAHLLTETRRYVVA